MINGDGVETPDMGATTPSVDDAGDSSQKEEPQLRQFRSQSQPTVGLSGGSLRWRQQLDSLTHLSSLDDSSFGLRLVSHDQFHPSMMTLRDGISLTRLKPNRNWDVLLVGGYHTLLSQFAHLARVFGALLEQGLPVAVIEPDSILMGSDGQFSILSSRLLSREDLDLDLHASRIAPEILLANYEAEIEESQIVYALAVLLHECVVGSPPWAGRDATEVADRLLSGSSVLETSEISMNPPGLKGLLRDALSLDPNKRPSTLRGFAKMLEAVRDGERPRSRGRTHGSGVSPAGNLRIGLFAGLIILATVLGRFLGTDSDQFESGTDLQKGMLIRPLPVHGEEQPLADHAIRWFQRFDQKEREGFSDPRHQLDFAWVCLRAGEYDRARQSAHKAARELPESPEPWVILGIAALEKGDSAGRIEIENGLRHSSMDVSGLWSRVAGHLYLLQNRKANELLNILSVETPNDPSVWFHRALCELRTGQTDSARSSIARYMELNPLDGWGDWLNAEIAFAEGRLRSTELILESAQVRLNHDRSLAIRTSSLWDRLGRAKTAHEWQKRSLGENNSEDNSWAGLEWRNGGRLVMPQRSVLFLGPPAPPEKIEKSSE